MRRSNRNPLTFINLLSLAGEVHNLKPVVGVRMCAGGAFGHHHKFSLHPMSLEPGRYIDVPVFRVLSLANRVDTRGELQMLTGGLL